MFAEQFSGDSEGKGAGSECLIQKLCAVEGFNARCFYSLQDSDAP